MPEQATKTARKRATTRKAQRATTPREPEHPVIAERACFIHLEEEGRDNEVENWLRAEREPAAA